MLNSSYFESRVLTKVARVGVVIGATLSVLMVTYGAGLSDPASSKKKKRGAAPAAVAPPPQPPVVLPEPPLPVQQAQAAGIGQCAPILDLMSHQTLTSRYDIQSGWSRSDPSHHIFQSVAALNNPANTPPDGFAALVAAPVTSGGCDGVALQVFPLKGDCASAQQTMLRGGKVIGQMLNSRIMLDARGNRVILLPAYNNTCIALSVETRFGAP